MEYHSYLKDMPFYSTLTTVSYQRSINEFCSKGTECGTLVY